MTPDQTVALCPVCWPPVSLAGTCDERLDIKFSQARYIYFKMLKAGEGGGVLTAACLNFTIFFPVLKMNMDWGTKEIIQFRCNISCFIFIRLSRTNCNLYKNVEIYSMCAFQPSISNQPSVVDIEKPFYESFSQVWKRVWFFLAWNNNNYAFTCEAKDFLRYLYSRGCSLK